MATTLLQGKLKSWLIIVFLSTILLSSSYFINFRSIQQLTYAWPSATARQMQVELNRGTSPNGTLDRSFGYSYTEEIRTKLSESPENYRFAIIKEETSPYITGTAVLDGEIPVPTGDFLALTKTRGSNQMIWHPVSGESLAIKSLTYNYGDVFGYIIVGQSARPYQDKQSYNMQIMLILWGITTVCSGLFIFGRNLRKRNQ